MKTKKIAALAMCASLALSANVSLAHGHNGGGHHNYDYTTTNNYNYHHYEHTGTHSSDCGNYPSHAHLDGLCPYTCDDTSYHYYRASTVKKVQNKLNKLGYDCGSADGVYGTQTKNCIKKYQNKKNMTVNGKINQKLLKKLKINS